MSFAWIVIGTSKLSPLFSCSLHSQNSAHKWFSECSFQAHIVDQSVYFPLILLNVFFPEIWHYFLHNTTYYIQYIDYHRGKSLTGIIEVRGLGGLGSVKTSRATWRSDGGRWLAAAMYSAATWGQCVCVGLWSTRLGGRWLCGQPGSFNPTSLWSSNWKPPACFPQPSVCLPLSDHSLQFIELAPEKTFVFTARASVKKLKTHLTPPALLFFPPSTCYFFLFLPPDCFSSS